MKRAFTISHGDYREERWDSGTRTYVFRGSVATQAGWDAWLSWRTAQRIRGGRAKKRAEAELEMEVK